MKPGDVIKHKPSGEKWLVAAPSPNGAYIACCGWPESLAPIGDCEIVQEATDAEAVELANHLRSHNSCRGSWARAWLDAKGVE